MPAQLERRRGAWTLPPIGAEVALRHAPDASTGELARARLEAALQRLGLRLGTDDAGGSIALAHAVLPGGPEAYRLTVAEEGLTLTASTEVGLAHAAATAAQLLRSAPAESRRRLDGLVIEDAPAFAVRGAMLDVSRDRMPKLAYLEDLVERLAAHKLNHLELYVEHTFAFPGHEEVWRDASPLTPEDVRRLDDHASAHGVRLVPNLQSFGHFHRWLTRPRYAHLAEHPEGIEHAFAFDPEPFGLCPTDPASLSLLEELYDAYLPCFRAREFNAGLDETLDLGLGRSRRACERLGRGRVYANYLAEVHARVRDRGRRMTYWGDVALEYPELVPELPRDATALVWGYEAGHPFDERCATLASHGLTFRVCPGTSSWQSGTGRLGNARANLTEAAAAGLRHGAEGLVVTDWGDFGHWQPPSIAWPGLALGAARAWNPASEPRDLARVLDLHWPAGGGGAALCALGELVDDAGGRAINGAPWFFALRYAERPFPPATQVPRFDGPALDGLEAAARARLGALPGGEPSLRREVDWAASFATWAARVAAARVRGGAGKTLAQLDLTERRRLEPDGRAVLEGLRELWPLRSRSGGLADSAEKLERVLRSLAAPE